MNRQVCQTIFGIPLSFVFILYFKRRAFSSLAFFMILLKTKRRNTTNNNSTIVRTDADFSGGITSG